MKSLKLSAALMLAALFGAACGMHETTTGTSGQTANRNAPAAPAVNTNAAGDNGKPTTAQSAAGDGAALYQSKGCAVCHGADGKGNAQMKDIPNFTDAAWQKKTADGDMLKLIQNGKPPMPAYKNQLTDDQINALVAYIRTFTKQ